MPVPYGTTYGTNYPSYNAPTSSGGSGSGGAAAGAVGGALIDAAGNYIGQRANAKFDKAQAANAQKIADQNYQAQLAWQQGLQSNPLFAKMIGDQFSTSSGYDNSTTNFDQRSKGQLSPEFAGLPEQVKNRYQEASLRPIVDVLNEAGVLQGERAAANAPAARIAAQHGVGLSELGPTAGDRQAAAAIKDAGLAANEREYALQNQNLAEQANLANMLAEVFKTGTTTSRSQQQSTSRGPGDYGTALSMLAPPERQRFVY